MLCLGDDSGPNLHSWQLVHPHVGYCTGAVQSACCVRSAIDTMKLYWIKGLSASTNYSKEHIGFYKTPKLAFIRSTLIHFSSSGILLLPYNQCLLELRSWQGDVHTSCNIVVPAECCYHGMHPHGVAEHKKQGGGGQGDGTDLASWTAAAAQSSSLWTTGVAQRGVPAGSVCRGRFFTETSAIVVLAEVALCKSWKVQR